MIRRLLSFFARRPCVTVDTTINGARMTIGIGFDPETGAALEAFADIARGTDQQHSLSDACVAVSVALQYGVPPEALEHSLGRIPAWVEQDGAMVLGEAPASPVGAVLEAVRMVSDGIRNDPGFFDGGEVR
jgi:ribonucleoside-diphosphate reductase alpha chain